MHVVVYSSILSVFDWKWAFWNGAAHFVVDYFTSRGSSFFFSHKEIHWAFLVIGFDQLIHTVLLIKTWGLFG